MLDVPFELLYEIGSHLDFGSYQNLRKTCKRVYQMARTPLLTQHAYLCSLPEKPINYTHDYPIRLVQKDALALFRTLIDHFQQQQLLSILDNLSRWQRQALFDKISKSSCHELFNILYRDPVTIKRQCVIDDAVEFNHAIVFEKRIDNIDAVELSSKACHYGHTDLLRHLVEMYQVDVAPKRELWRLDACIQGHLSILKYLVQDLGYKSGLAPLFELSCLNGHLHLVKFFVEECLVDPTSNSNNGLKSASVKGHSHVVKYLMSDDRIDPSCKRNYCLRWASKNGHLQVVRQLLTDRRVEPQDDDNFALQACVEQGHAAIVKLLLADPRVDPSDRDYHAVGLALKLGNVDIVEMLLQRVRLNDCHMLFKWLVDQKSLQGLQLVFELGSFDKKRMASLCLPRAQISRQVSIIRFLKQFQ
ncbi:ankyrin repeat-containing domain protein [Gorgonomyces haynaldii]|nr:ankyrin repeat-containing domain protein [Gorgonomyces haynaldii]